MICSCVPLLRRGNWPTPAASMMSEIGRMRDLTVLRGNWTQGIGASAATEREVLALSVRQHRAKILRRRAEEALARVASGALHKERARAQRQREAVARAQVS